METSVFFLHLSMWWIHISPSGYNYLPRTGGCGEVYVVRGTLIWTASGLQRCILCGYIVPVIARQIHYNQVL